MLNQQRKLQLDAIVSKMTQAKESDNEIQFVVDDFKAKYDQPDNVFQSSPFSKGNGVNNIPTTDDRSIAQQVGTGLVKGGISTFKGASSLGEKGLRAGLKTLLPKGLEERFGVGDEQDQTTAAEQLIPEEVTTPETTAEKVGFLGEQIAEFFLPIPGLKAAKLATGASKAGKLGKLGLEAGEIAGRTALQTGDIGSEEIAAGVTAPIIGGAGTAFGKFVTKSLPERFIKSALGARKKDLVTTKAVDNVLKNKKIGTSAKLLEDSQETMTKLNSEIDKLIVATGKVDKVDDLANAITKSEFGKASLTTPDEVLDTINRLVPESRSLLAKEELTTKEINKLRQLVDRKLGDRFFLSTTQGAEGKELLGAARDVLSKKVKADAKGTEELFKNLSEEISFSDVLGKTVERGKGNQVISFGDLFGAGIGGTVGGVPGAIAGAGARRVLQSTPFLTGVGVTAQELGKAGPILQKLAPGEKAVLSQIFQKIYAGRDEQGMSIAE